MKDSKMKKKVHAQIEYTGIHSDICPPDCDFDEIDDKYRLSLHADLDEWLDKSDGTGAFRIYQRDVLPDQLGGGYKG